jgi:hypothetical protein
MPESKEIPEAQRVLALFAAALALFGFTALATRGSPLQVLLVGEDNRYSNSKTQMSLWLGLTLCSYLASVALRGLAWQWNWSIGIPQNLLVLSGLSGLSFATAKGITSRKVADAKAAEAIDPKAPQKCPALKPEFPYDLLYDDDGKFDVGDYQMILITVIAAVCYLLFVFRFLGTVEMYADASLPDVDTTLLGLFGVGQGAYLAKKAVSGIKS